MDELVRFMESMAGDSELEEALIGAQDEAAVVQIARQRQFNFSVQDVIEAVDVARGVLRDADAEAPFSEEDLASMAGRLGLILFVVRMLGQKRHERF
jgi:predicted ribosomally synthesized peptide with nif11-like leader